MSIPSEKTMRERLYKYIEQSVSLMREKDILDEDIKEVGNIVVGEFDIKKAEYSSMVKAAYDVNKMEDEIESRKLAISNVEILKG